jgi:hypothetical protein
VFDYSVAPSRLGVGGRLALAAFARRVAQIGEPWTTSFDPDELDAELRRIGFHEVRDLDPRALNETYFAGRSDELWVGSLGHVLVARV